IAEPDPESRRQRNAEYAERAENAERLGRPSQSFGVFGGFGVFGVLWRPLLDVRFQIHASERHGQSHPPRRACRRARRPRDRGPAEVARRANEHERLAHGTPSGIDASAIAYERPIIFMRDGGKAKVSVLVVGKAFRLAIGILPRTGTTASLVAGVHRRKSER